MLLSNINNFNKSDYEKLETIVALLKSQEFNNIEDGRIHIDDKIYIQVLSYNTEDISNVNFEIHRNRYDVHYIVSGEETIILSQETDVSSKSYNKDRDLEMVTTPKYCNEIILKQGDFLIIGMDEPHKTNGYVNSKSSFVKKVVVKVER